MSEQNPTKTGPNWMFFGLLVVVGVAAVALLLGPLGSSDDEGEDASATSVVKSGKNSEVYTLNVGAKKASIPADSEVVVFAKMEQVLRSPMLPMLELNRERIWSRMRLDPRVKTFLETSGLNLEQSKEFALFIRGLRDHNKAPQVVADWKGSFERDRVTKSFRDALGATDIQVGDKKALAGGTIALSAEDTLVLGNRPLFDDALGLKGDFGAIPQVQELLSHLGKQGAVTAIARSTSMPRVKVPLIPLEKLEWLGVTLETMGSPKVRLAGLTASEDEAKELAEAIEGALGMASLGLSAKGGDVDAIVSLIERIKIETKGRVMTLSVDMPLSKLPGLIKSISGLTR